MIGRIGLAVASLIATLTAAKAEPRIYTFTWEGGGGFEMRGALAFDGAARVDLITEAEVDCFVITGFRNGVEIGRWALGMLTDETSWTLTFDPVAEAFVVYGPVAYMPQAWNMNGYGEDCGDPGFGFNIGNAAQDLCVDGTLQFDSQIDPGRAFPAERVEAYEFPEDAGPGCNGPALIGWMTTQDRGVQRG